MVGGAAVRSGVGRATAGAAGSDPGPMCPHPAARHDDPMIPRAALPLIAVVLAACSATSTGPDRPPTRSATGPLAANVDLTALADNHTAHVGDNSRMVALVAAVHPEVVGSRTIALQTRRQPYGLELRLDTVRDGMGRTSVLRALQRRAVLLMACTDNLGVVTWTLPHPMPATGQFTRVEATRMAGRPLDGTCTREGLSALATHLG